MIDLGLLILIYSSFWFPIGGVLREQFVPWLAEIFHFRNWKLRNVKIISLVRFFFLFCLVSSFYPFICRMGVECHPVLRYWFSVSLWRLRLDRSGFSGFWLRLLLLVLMSPFVVAAWWRQLILFPWPCILHR